MRRRLQVSLRLKIFAKHNDNDLVLDEESPF